MKCVPSINVLTIFNLVIKVSVLSCVNSKHMKHLKNAQTTINTPTNVTTSLDIPTKSTDNQEIHGHNHSYHDTRNMKYTTNNGYKSLKELKEKTDLTKNLNKAKRKKSKSLTSSRGNNKGKVFQDSREDTLHYKIIDNMFFEPLESNNRSASISFSDESEITEDDIEQAAEGRDGSFIAIPLKRKKDAYSEFLKWAHIHEKNGRLVKARKEVFEKYKNKLKTQFHNVSLSKDVSPKTKKQIVNITIKNNNISAKDTSLSHSRMSNGNSNFGTKPFQSNSTLKKSNANIVVTSKVKSLESNIPKRKPLNKPSKVENQKHFRAESVEFQYDPDFLNTLHNTVKKQRQKGNKKKTQKNTDKEDRIDISADDYSAMEEFMLHTQKEAMGRRFYQLFANKSASDFWDNNTLETTKMLEILLPLGKHLHKSLDEVLPNEGVHFITNLQIYKRELEKFVALVKADKAETRNDVVDLLEEPNEHVCETQYCEEEVKIMFGWNDQQFKTFEKLLKETRKIWFDLQLFHHCYQFVSESAESISSSSYNCSDFNFQNHTFTG